MPTTISNRGSAARGLEAHVVDARGPWSELAAARSPELLRLRDSQDEVVLTGPLDVNLSIYAEHEMTGASGAVSSTRQPLTSHDISVPAGSTWRYGMDRLQGLGGNAGCSAWIRVARPRPEPALIAAGDLPCDFAVRSLADSGAFFPTPCDPCEGGPIRVPPMDCGPAVDVLPARGGCVRPRYFNGMYITREDLEAGQRYVRMKLRLQNRAQGTGVVWGLDVALRGEQVVVGAGYAVDCCGNDLTVTCDYAVSAAHLLRDPLVCGSDRRCYSLLLEYVECPQDPRPIHGDGCEPRRSGCEMSRIRETVRLRLVASSAAPQRSPLARFLQRVDELRTVVGTSPQPVAIPVAGAATVPAPDSVDVPFRVVTTLGTELSLQPSRTGTVEGTIEPVNSPNGLISVRAIPQSTSRGLDGSVLRDDGTLVTTVAAAGAQWVASYDPQATSFTYRVDWSTAAPEVLRGSTLVSLDMHSEDDLEGRIRTTTDQFLDTEWPAGHGLEPGDQVRLVTAADGKEHTAFADRVNGNIVRLSRPAGARIGLQDRLFVPGRRRLHVQILPTRILLEPAQRATACCGGGCCDEREPLDPRDRLLALLAALLYGRIVQRNSMLATEASGTRVVAALRTFLGVRTQGIVEFEVAVVALYRAWCGGALYAGPEHCDPDGVVIGCARVQAGALCEVDPLDGRRWVVHQPLLDHWAGLFGLDPLDRRIGELFKRLCCISHLPGFGSLVDAGLPADDDQPSPSLNGFLLGRTPSLVAFAGTGVRQPPAAAGSRRVAVAPSGDALDALARIGDLDLLDIAALVERLLCGDVRASRDVVREPERTRAFVAEAFADLPTREQPRLALRDAAREITRTVLAAVPAAVAVGLVSPLAGVLDSLRIESLDDLLAVPDDVVAEVGVAVAAPEQVDDGLAQAKATAQRVVETVAGALKALSTRGLTNPKHLKDEKVVAKLAGEIVKRLKQDAVDIEPEPLADALLVRSP